MAVLGVVLGSSPVWANSTVELLQILATLERIHDVVRNVRGVTEDIRAKLLRVWPERAIRPIAQIFTPVMSIKQEIEALSCGWQFSLRMERIRLGIYGGMGFCKQEWRNAFGGEPRGWSKDLEEYYDWSAVRRLNAVGTHARKNTLWAAEAAWLTNEARRGTFNAGEDIGPEGRPGYAQRLAALGSAQLGNLMVESSKLQAYELELAQEKLNDRRRRQHLQEAFAQGTYRMLTLRVTPPIDVGGAATLPGSLR